MPEALERCPACRADLAGNAVCRRCGCDFSLVRVAEEQAERRLTQALCAYAGGDLAGARAHLGASLASHRLPLAQALAVVIDSGRRGLHADDHWERRHLLVE